ncbi:MAG TPA: protein-L-isoaspartate(D-aspartate) O-methyltransferase [Luteimonas sp.]|nr:protein-L-isoaspartate(D-aspartate) O-methyltransferase [Luteimonas sp.]HRO28291.1 protein-L-isoaspartate(D-aspartate) O-methyltransferase [Luteimonas sp.]HRP71415.1 protein-L-isoaspartate(D-aspartate) O-methyltransferase [Luteimonas sp.]
MMTATGTKRRRPRGWGWLLGLFCINAAACAEPVGPPGGDDAARRNHMVERQLAGRGIDDARVLEVMRKVERHRFVPESFASQAYEDNPLPIGHGQTISQPYIVALMTQLARPAPGDRVLEVGTGSGYQAAVLAELVAQVYSIEIVAPLAGQAAALLDELGYGNVEVRAGDGYAGWPEHAPFDAIVVTAAPERIPAPLLEQLGPGGRLVIPVGPIHAVQELRVVEKRADGSLHEQVVTPVRFVPLTGEAADQDRTL